MKTAFITGTAGFIGFHLAERLLSKGWRVASLDGMTNYYDVSLKEMRVAKLSRHPNFEFTKAMLEDETSVHEIINRSSPDIIVHLAAQAGVRYSLENPRAYINANIIGTFNVLEAARASKTTHLLMASTSSAYGANTQMPFTETQKADTPLTLYAATKKSNESMAHSYSHIHSLPTTMFRFFTVYGPWGRPDMALFRFTKAILEGRPIDIYNKGNMWRDFTYVTDLVLAIELLIDAIPGAPDTAVPGDSLSPVAPFRIVNIGNSDKVCLLDFIKAVEETTGKQAVRNYLPMQTGDVPATWADCTLLHELTGYRPQTSFHDGIRHFVGWYREHYHS